MCVSNEIMHFELKNIIMKNLNFPNKNSKIPIKLFDHNNSNTNNTVNTTNNIKMNRTNTVNPINRVNTVNPINRVNTVNTVNTLNTLNRVNKINSNSVDTIGVKRGISNNYAGWRGKTKFGKELFKLKKDPKRKDNPLGGRLIVLIFTSTAILFTFFAQMIYNKTTFGGRCITRVLYNQGQRNSFIPIGHGACEFNLMADAANRVFMGPSEADSGWPITIVNNAETKTNWHFPFETDSNTFQINSIFSFGGLETNYIRHYKEYFRIIWSTFMHKGVAHLLINLLSQIQILWIIEPDWGFVRTFLLYFISAFGSSITSASLDPCYITVGSSGALYGLYGGLLPYIIEYWVTLPYPIFLIIFLVISIIIGVLMGFTQNIDNYAHLGGCMFGLLWGFATIRSISIFDACTIYETVLLSKPFSCIVTQGYKEKLRISKGIKQNLKGKNVKFSDETRSRFDFIFKRLEKNGTAAFKNRLREWIVRIIALILLVSLYGACIKSNRSLLLAYLSLLLTLLVTSLIMLLLLFEEKLYSKFKPWGQPKFSGFAKCVCCYIKPQKLTKLHLPANTFWCFDDDNNANAFCQFQHGLDGGVVNTTKAAAQHLLDYIT